MWKKGREWFGMERDEVVQNVRELQSNMALQEPVISHFWTRMTLIKKQNRCYITECSYRCSPLFLHRVVSSRKCTALCSYSKGWFIPKGDFFFNKWDCAQAVRRNQWGKVKVTDESAELVAEKEDGDTAGDLLSLTFLTIQFPVLGPAI